MFSLGNHHHEDEEEEEEPPTPMNASLWPSSNTNNNNNSNKIGSRENAKERSGAKKNNQNQSNNNNGMSTFDFDVDVPGDLDWLDGFLRVEDDEDEEENENQNADQAWGVGKGAAWKTEAIKTTGGKSGVKRGRDVATASSAEKKKKKNAASSTSKKKTIQTTTPPETTTTKAASNNNNNNNNGKSSTSNTNNNNNNNNADSDRCRFDAVDAGASRAVFEIGENARRFGYRHAERRRRADASARGDYSAREITLAKVQITRAANEQSDVQRAIEGVEHRGEEFFDVHVCRAASDNRQRGEGHSESRLDYEQSTTRGDYFASKRHRE